MASGKYKVEEVHSNQIWKSFQFVVKIINLKEEKTITYHNTFLKEWNIMYILCCKSLCLMRMLQNTSFFFFLRVIFGQVPYIKLCIKVLKFYMLSNFDVIPCHAIRLLIFYAHRIFFKKILPFNKKKGSVIKNTIGEKRDTDVKRILSVSNWKYT